MSELISRASNLLVQMYDPDTGLFSYSTRVVDGKYTNDFNHPLAQRYTINTLAGLWKLRRSNLNLWGFDDTLETYLRHQSQNISNPGDKGLLLYVLSLRDHPNAAAQFELIDSLTNREDIYCGQPIQNACWQLYGLIEYAMRFESDSARLSAMRCMKWLQQHFMNSETLLPYHQTSGLRRRFVSFGAITYFLKALYQYAHAFDDAQVLDVFKAAVRKIISKQGRNGEWAWFYDVKTGQVMDWYEVYSVHQEAMAMLFLLPALDSGVVEARDAVRKSFEWLFGTNELGLPMMVEKPFISYRSIRRRGPLQRQKRFARSMLLSSRHKSGIPAPTDQLEINSECRSYEMGWTLYAWADRRDFPEITGLEGLLK